MSIKIFLSAVSNEFRSYRDLLRKDLTRHNVEVKVAEDFPDFGGEVLDKLDVYISRCDAVVHLVGDMCGAAPSEREQAALLRKYPDLSKELPPLSEAWSAGTNVTYVQWEAWLALYHKKLLLIAEAEELAPRDPRYAPTDDSRTGQKAHLRRLRAVRRYPGCTFANEAELAKHIGYTGILDLLVKDYASQEAQAKEVAEGFIREMAGRVAADKALDFEGMKQAVRNAIDVYETEIAGGIVETNIDAIVDAALQKAKTQVDKGQSGLARATLRRAAEEMRRDEQERREGYEQGVRLLYQRERDIALAAYDGEAAAQAGIELAEALHGDLHALLWDELKREEVALFEFGRDRGSNVHLVAAIGLDRRLAALARNSDEKVAALNALGIDLQTLGEREGGKARLEEAVATFRGALVELAREPVSLQWAVAQNNLGTALIRLGEREVGTQRLEEAIAAFRAALEFSGNKNDLVREFSTQN